MTATPLGRFLIVLVLGSALVGSSPFMRFRKWAFFDDGLLPIGCGIAMLYSLVFVCAWIKGGPER